MFFGSWFCSASLSFLSIFNYEESSGQLDGSFFTNELQRRRTHQNTIPLTMATAGGRSTSGATIANDTNSDEQSMDTAIEMIAEYDNAAALQARIIATYSLFKMQRECQSSHLLCSRLN